MMVSGNFSASATGDSLRPRLTDVRRFPIFVSYGDEAKDLKTTLKRLVEEVVNKQLSHADWPIELPVWDWRDIASQRAPHDGKTNDLFVEKARTSSATIVVLFDHLPPGTAEELEAIIGDDDVDLKVFWLNRRRRFQKIRGVTEVHDFLRQHQDDFSYVELFELGSESTWIKLTSNILAVLLKALRSHDRPPYTEARGSA